MKDGMSKKSDYFSEDETYVNKLRTSIKWVLLCMVCCIFGCLSAQKDFLLKVEIDSSIAFQTIHNFAASDAWAAQYVGNWPDKKKNDIADLLFSREYQKDGSPVGIGLSAWRFNIGAGSGVQGEQSGIKDPWRRTEGFLQDDGSYHWQNQSGQQWFLHAAKERGVNQFIAFVNSPPIQLTKNGRAHSQDGLSANLPKDGYVAYASFLTKVLQHFKKDVGIDFDYISPFNEPQWEWKGGQEGSPWNNDELAQMAMIIDSVFRVENIGSKIEITEAGAIDYLTVKKDKYANRSNQIEEFFNPKSSSYLGDLESIAPKIAAHSYFTTWNMEALKKERQRIAGKLLKYPSLEYWMSEYCILENNEEIKGKSKDLGMQTALYVARVIHADLTIANTSAWHWWLAMSPYDFKDGLVYHDKETVDGTFTDSKLLWALGNYSKFIRPGAERIKVAYTDYNKEKTLKEGVLISAFRNMDNSIVVVAVNQRKDSVEIQLKLGAFTNFNMYSYVTDHKNNLAAMPKNTGHSGQVKIHGKSITTLLLKPE